MLKIGNMEIRKNKNNLNNLYNNKFLNISNNTYLNENIIYKKHYIENSINNLHIKII